MPTQPKPQSQSEVTIEESISKVIQRYAEHTETTNWDLVRLIKEGIDDGKPESHWRKTLEINFERHLGTDSTRNSKSGQISKILSVARLSLPSDFKRWNLKGTSFSAAYLELSNKRGKPAPLPTPGWTPPDMGSESFIAKQGDPVSIPAAPAAPSYSPSPISGSIDPDVPAASSLPESKSKRRSGHATPAGGSPEPGAPAEHFATKIQCNEQLYFDLIRLLQEFNCLLPQMVTYTVLTACADRKRARNIVQTLCQDDVFKDLIVEFVHDNGLG